MSTDNQSERADWNGESGQRWVADADGRDRVLRPVADALLAEARLRPGERVLDVGCGCGATTLAAAGTVGPSGHVLGADLSQLMLDVARQRLAGTSLTNVTLHVADVQTDALGEGDRDAAISRFGTMFFNDPAAAFANVARALRPGGRLTIATWQALAANDWLTIPGAALLEYGQLPDFTTTDPGMFAQSDPDRITQILTAAGFGDIQVQPLSVSFHLGDDTDAATTYLASSGVGRAVLATIPDDRQPAALDAVRAVLTSYQSDDGVRLDGAILLTSARRT